MKISVILPICKAEKQLEQAIDSVLAQDLGEGFELLIVNDHPSSVHSEILSGYRHLSSLRILETGGGAGLPAALNLALAHARGKYILRMDGADVMAPTLLRQTFEHHERLGDGVAFVSVRRYWLSFSGKSYHKMSASETGHVHEYWEDLMERRHGFTDSGTLFRKSLALAAGGYRGDDATGADVDLWLRLFEQSGRPCLTLGDLLVGKRLRPGSRIFQNGDVQPGFMARALALERREKGWPADHQPAPESILQLKKTFFRSSADTRNVHMPVDIAMINLWLKDYAGFAAFLGLAARRNPVRTARILVRHGIFGWFHDFIEGPPPIEPLHFMFQLQGQNQPTSAPNGRR